MHIKIKNISFLLIIAAIFSSFSCKKDVSLFYYPEKMVEYLQLRKDQEEVILPKLVVIQKEIFDFLGEWRRDFRTSYRFDSKSEREKFMEERDVVLKKIGDIVDEIVELLDNEQQKRFLNIEVPEVYLEEMMMVQMEYRRENQKKEVSEVKVFQILSRDDIPDEIPDLTEILEKWTVTFGMRRASGGGFFGMSGNQGAGERTGFPLKITATLIDPLIIIAKEKEKDNSTSPDAVIPYFDKAKNDLLEIQVSISTPYHESYLDLDKWIIYLENDDVEQFESTKIEKRENTFLGETRNSRRPIYSRRATSKTSKGSSRANLNQIFGGYSNTAYYSLFFKNKIYGKPIITEDTEFIKLVFLKEVGTNERSEGKWSFEKR